MNSIRLGSLVLIIVGSVTLAFWFVLSASDLCDLGACTYPWLTPVLWVAILAAGVLSIVGSVGLLGYSRLKGKRVQIEEASMEKKIQKHDHILRNVGLLLILLFGLTLGGGSVLSPILYPGYGLSSGSTASVSVTSVTCSNADGVCTLQLTNTGSVQINAVGCYFLASGANKAGVLSPNPAVIQAGTFSPVTCSSSGSMGGRSGSSVAGSITLSNGESAVWSGTWQ